MYAVYHEADQISYSMNKTLPLVVYIQSCLTMTERRADERSNVHFTVKWYVTSFTYPVGLTSDGGVLPLK